MKTYDGFCKTRFPRNNKFQEINILGLGGWGQDALNWFCGMGGWGQDDSNRFWGMGGVGLE